MKKRIFPILATFGLLLAGAAVFGTVASKTSLKQAKATDYGTFTFSEANSDSQVGFMYGVNWDANELPAGWDTTAFHPVDVDSGTFVDGNRVGTEIKKIGANTYYIPVSGATVGTVATVKGTWSNGSDTFTVNEFVRQWNGSKWDYALADYDVVSLADANMPDFEEGTAINTEDDANYSYVTDPAGLPKKRGFFGLTNDTGSYVFQFDFNVSSQAAGWIDIRIGGNGPWGTGHFLKYSFSNEWNAAAGCGYVYECLGNGDIWNPTVLQQSPEFVAKMSGGDKVIELGAIKVLGYETLHYVFFKINDEVQWGGYWDLDEAPRTTKVGIYTGRTNVSITNSKAITDKYQISINPASSTATVLYFNTGIDFLKPISNWDDYFIPVEGGIKLNGTPITDGKWNYFKKTEATMLYLSIGDLGVTTPVEGDVLYVGGIFKMAKDIGGVNRLYRMYLYDHYFQFDGTKWFKIDPDYSAVDFSKDLLKETLAICTGGDADNGAALADVWSTLANSSHYAKLKLDEKEELILADMDSTIVVPLTELEIDAMSDSDAIAAAMYRYEYCTAKYSLDAFISGRTITLSNTGITVFKASSNIDASIIIICAVTLSLCAFGICAFYLRKRKEDR